MTKLPTLIAGPILRHTSSRQLTLWLVTTRPIQANVTLWLLDEKQLPADQITSHLQQHQVQVGHHCFVQLLVLEGEIPEESPLTYQIYDVELPLLGDNEKLFYPHQPGPVVVVKSCIKRLLHGSCRKPHYPNDDALVQADQVIGETLFDSVNRPALMMFSGDQVYADDVAGPMLVAIHQLIEILGLFDEEWQGTEARNLKALLKHPHCYYGREDLLPDVDQEVEEAVFRAGRKPIFTTDAAHNHLITLSEVMAMYLLVWSDIPWQWVDIQTGRQRIPEMHIERYDREANAIQSFRDDLPRVRRVLAHLPVYMMFDDHDVTDDWNLTRGWEEAAYGHPFSRRIIGNTLIGYWLCQGWGNQPSNYQPLANQLNDWFSDQGLLRHDDLIKQILDWGHWHYHLNTTPKLVVMDTRTHRWRSESSANKPSGLMDWESLCEMQQQLINQPAVILVSPAPIFGVKLIEVIQSIFTFFGKPLLVDAENWMAHPGSANVMLNIFRHQQTPPQFIILSGDVHYSFAYDITLRFRRNSPRILQITASGLKNEFPHTLLSWFDRINLALFGSRSPLNFLTRRRDMKVQRRKPNGGHDRVLLNHNGIGDVVLADKIEDVRVRIRQSDGKVVAFETDDD